MKDIGGSSYTELKLVNIMVTADEKMCYRGNPELFASAASVDAVNCYGIARGYHECGGYSGHTKV